MTRVAGVAYVIFGVMLLLVSFYPPDGGDWYAWVERGMGAVAIVVGFVSVRTNKPVQLSLVIFALIMLARFLPPYFQSPNLWPGLAMIGASMFAFGFGLLAWILSRYTPNPDSLAQSRR